MKATYIYLALVVLIIGGLIVLRNASNGSAELTTEYDVFAECLGAQGAKFYGAYWCPHCKEQKEMFENSRKLPYVECSLPNGQGQTQECIDAGVKSYPLWKFADGSVLEGTRQLSELAEKTSCTLP